MKLNTFHILIANLFKINKLDAVIRPLKLSELCTLILVKLPKALQNFHEK